MTAHRHETSAYHRAHSAMRVADHAGAIEAADVAILAMLSPGLTVRVFIRKVLAGVHAQQLLRVNAAQIPFDRTLREPFTLRWEALRRSGRAAEAAEMRALCLRLWPERASVWSAAGNHALDEGDFDGALRYFQHCLERQPNSVAGLAGRAIVYEVRKDWQRALESRAAVVEVSGALGRSDGPGLHRMVRYGVALVRAGRRAEAGRHLRHCVDLGAFQKVPAERPVLLRAFCRDLYSPATIAKLPVGTAADASLSEDLQLARLESHCLERACQRLYADSELTMARRALLLGSCAWEAGDPERAFAHFDVADAQCELDVATNYLLMMSAAATNSAEFQSIERYAREAAVGALAAAAAGTRVAEVELLYAALTLTGQGDDSRFPLADIASRDSRSTLLGSWSHARTKGVSAALPALATIPENDFAARVLWWSAWRELHRQLGYTSVAVARAAPASLLQG